MHVPSIILTTGETYCANIDIVILDILTFKTSDSEVANPTRYRALHPKDAGAARKNQGIEMVLHQNNIYSTALFCMAIL